MKKIVVLTGAGVSAESGISTFRDSGGLWEQYAIEEVATPDAFKKNPSLVLDFYNMRRKNVLEAQPNYAHFALAQLDNYFHTVIITQNIDDLHERSGSKNIIHLHGEIMKARSTHNPKLIVDISSENPNLKMGDKAQDGAQLRPHIVWFGEAVPLMDKAIKEVSSADVILIIGTSLQVYPAASLHQYAPTHAHIYYIDPNASENISQTPKHNFWMIEENASIAIPPLVDKLIKEHA